MPPLLNAPSGSTGPAAPPTANMGAEADGDTKMREAVHLMEMALPRFQLGGDKHKAVIDAINKLSKAFPPSGEVPGAQQTQLTALMQRAKQQAMMQQAMRQQQGGMGGQGGGPPGAPQPPQAGMIGA